MIAKIPDDPFKIGYAIDSKGVPVFRNTIRASEPTKKAAQQ